MFFYAWLISVSRLNETDLNGFLVGSISHNISNAGSIHLNTLICVNDLNNKHKEY